MGISMQEGLNQAAEWFINRANAQLKFDRLCAEVGKSGPAFDQIRANFETEMNKGIAGVGLADIAPSIPQDLDPVFRSVDAKDGAYGLNMMSQCINKQQGYGRKHEYVLQVATGLGRSGGASSEFGVGNSSKPTMAKLASYPKWIKVLFQKSRASDDVRTLEEANEAAERQNRRNLLRLINQATIWGDTRTQLNGVNGIRAKGLLQLIEEGTNGTLTDADTGAVIPNDGINYNGLGHTVDWKCQGPSKPLIREQMQNLIDVWGIPDGMTMFAPHNVVMGLEALEDGNRRGTNPTDFAIGGQVVTGMVIGGTVLSYVPEWDLNPFARDSIANGFYQEASAPEGAPTGAPACTATLQAEGTTDGLTYGCWDDNPLGGNSRNTVRYVVTYRDANDMESVGVLSNATLVTGNGTNEMKLVITGVPAGATQIRIYRVDTQYLSSQGKSVAAREACWIMNATPSADGSPVTVIDHNLRRPYTGTAIIMRVQGPMWDYVSRGGHVFREALRSGALADAMAVMSTQQSSTWAENVARQIHVGPAMFTNFLANVADTRQHYVAGSWFSNEITNPNLCAIIRNIPIKNIAP